VIITFYFFLFNPSMCMDIFSFSYTHNSAQLQLITWHLILLSNCGMCGTVRKVALVWKSEQEGNSFNWWTKKRCHMASLLIMVLLITLNHTWSCVETSYTQEWEYNIERFRQGAHILVTSHGSDFLIRSYRSFIMLRFAWKILQWHVI